MNKKTKTLVKYLSIFVILFFASFQRVYAVKETAHVVRITNKDKYISLTYKPSNIPNYTRKLEAWLFYVSQGEGTSKQAYCIQQNKWLGEAYTVEGVENYTAWGKNEAKIKKMIFEVMSQGYYVQTNAKRSEFIKTATGADVSKVLATQELIWEIIRGERTTFNPASEYAPKGNKDCNSTACPFYRLIKNNRGKTINTTPIWNEYTRIIKDVYYTFYVKPNGFGTKASHNTYSMDYKDGQFIYTLNDSNSAYKYFNVSTTDKNITAKVTNSGKTLTLTSTKPLTANATISLINKRSGETGKFYIDKEKQDVARGIASINYYLELSTPLYQIQINKKATLDGKPLQGVVFNVCEDSACTKKMGTVTTDAKGIAYFKNINHPGTYYVKETKVPEGYELDTKPKAVTVKTANIAGSTSYGTINVTNKNKEFYLTKKTVDEEGNEKVLEDGCGTEKYTGPEFEIKNSKGELLYFIEKSDGKYDLASKNTPDAITKVKTCKGKFTVYTLTDCNYTITETKAPEGLTLPSNTTMNVNVCGANKSLTFTNGFAGLEFQKKDEDGNFVSGGKFALQRKINNVYKDTLLKKVKDGNYEYDANLKESQAGATYILETKDGISRISKLPPGEYRIVEKEAPAGYELIKDKDSKALVTITDEPKGYYLVQMVDQKVRKNGSKASAELIITIITGRKVPNYVLIIGSLLVLLVVTIIIRKRMKK